MSEFRDPSIAKIGTPSGRVELQLFAFIALLLLATVMFSACGSDNSSASLRRVVPDARVFTADDLRAAGMKLSRQYDVVDLPGGVDAWYGFIRDDSGPKDIEARFYASHAEAVELGAGLAEEVSGKDANVDEETTTWKEGAKDRIRLSSGGTADLAAWSGSRIPNYADFVVFGNMVLLCQGDEPGQSIAVCHSLISALGESQ
ncbi:MAG: hypothetical protein O3B95_03980 [Chloroflexi bacterium]|nr:hypothetical protein [Chloroflexota bacterium]